MINIMELLKGCADISLDNTIKVVGVCAVMKSIWPDVFDNSSLYLKRDKEFTELICNNNGIKFHYYAKPKDTFFVWEAIAEAKEKGLSIVIVENMS